MKKLVLTSLFAMFAVSSVQAANVISNNPLYRPGEGHFYNVTSATTYTGAGDDFRDWIFATELGYGITDRLSFSLNTDVDMYLPKGAADRTDWTGMGGELSFRGIDDANWKMDVYGGLDVIGWDWYDEDLNIYTWKVGTRGGYVSGDWTLAAMAEYNYFNTEAFNWGDEFYMNHDWIFGLDGQYSMDDNWNITAGVHYYLYEDYNDDDPIVGTFGVNYNFDSTKFIGVYTERQLNAESGNDTYEWGMKFGIDF